MIYIMINLHKLNKNILLNETCLIVIISIEHLFYFIFLTLTMLRWCLFFCIWHWRGGGVIVWIRIITTFNLPSMRWWWWWRTMNINYWCPWRSHNLKLNEKRKESNEHYFSLILSMIKFLFSYFFFLSFSIVQIFIVYVCVCIICD